jgi:ubiquinone/menaquinone biosynthesis C-methylase UbiE
VEREKYEWLNKNSRNYGKSFHGKKFTEYLIELNKQDSINSIVDIGTGRGEFCKWAAENLCNEVIGVDFVFESREKNKDNKITYYKCFAHDLSLKDKSIDMLTSFDMLEHLVEDDIDIVFEEFFRVTKKYFLFTISHSDSKTHRKNVGSLHPTVKPREWWLEKIKKYGEINRVKVKNPRGFGILVKLYNHE